jgi:macrolide-specific efflux system membrane fusion protein
VNLKGFFMLLLLAGAAAGGWWFYQKRNAEPEQRYREVTVERGDVRETILATGVVEPQNRVEIKPPIPGRIDDVLVREGQAVKKGEIIAWMSSTDRAALLDAARARGEAELERWQQLYKAAPLLAPLDGEVIARKIEPGQTVTAADTVLVLSDRLIIKAQVDETDIGRVQLDQRVAATLDAYPATEIPSRVDHIAYEAETVNNVTMYMVDVLPDEVPAFMRSGMTADVMFHVRGSSGVLHIPSEAVRRDEGKTTVLVPGAGPEAPPRSVDVETGIDNGQHVEIVTGLSEGQTVLIPAFRMQEAGNQTNPFMPSRPRRR